MLCEINFEAVERQFPNSLRFAETYSSLPQNDVDYQTRQTEAAREHKRLGFNLAAGGSILTFEDARFKLLAYIRNRIRNGDLTERALARQIGISQPHVHNALKGVRTLSPKVLDSILRRFQLSLLDLIYRPIGLDL